MCASTAKHQTASFSFDNLDQFSLNEILDNQGYLLLDVRGMITLSTAESSQDGAIVADVSMESHNIEIESTNFEKTATGLTIGNPELKNRSYFRRPYLTLIVAIKVKPGTRLSTFSIETRHLHIEVAAELDLAVAERSTLDAVSGHVNSPTAPAKFLSRKKYIRSVSGGIRGSYTLEDVLSCTTTSGGIHIMVIPKKAGELVLPAAFSARSVSGHVDVLFETFDVPERDYRVDVHSGSGGSSGTYIHGSRTSVTSGSGSKRVFIVPYEGAGDSEIFTDGASGGSDIEVRSPIKISKTLGALRSTHRSVSGHLSLRYPREWAGTFEGTSVSGSLSADGPGLEVEVGGGPGRKSVSGNSKLEGKAQLSFSSVSGGARLVVG